MLVHLRHGLSLSSADGVVEVGCDCAAAAGAPTAGRCRHWPLRLAPGAAGRQAGGYDWLMDAQGCDALHLFKGLQPAALMQVNLAAQQHCSAAGMMHMFGCTNHRAVCACEMRSCQDSCMFISSCTAHSVLHCSRRTCKCLSHTAWQPHLLCCALCMQPVYYAHLQVAAAADTALQETLRNIGHLLQAGQAALEGGGLGLLGSSSSSITSLNTVVQRGVDLQVGD